MRGEKMKFTLKRNEVLNEINIVKNIINKKSMKPILQNMLLNVTEEGLIIEGSDLEVGIRYKLPLYNTEENGKTTIPADKLSSILSEAPEEEVAFLVEKNNAYISSGSTNFTVSVMDADNYPKFPQIEKEDSFEIDFEKLNEMISKTIIGTAKDSARYVFRGILFEKKDDLLNLVATDSHILAKASANIENQAEGEMRVVVPRKILEELMKINYSGMVKISYSKQNIKFELDDVELVSRLIDAKYPKYEKVIPTINDKTAIITKEQLLDSFRRISAFIKSDTGRVSFYFKENQIKMIAKLEELGKAEDKFDINYEEEEIRLDLNYKYLKDILKTVSDENVQLDLYDEESAIIVKTEQNENFFWVIMPLAILE
ncbi:MAG: DNA polymerase III subunit beta [Candidatus Mcinerneyibacterium aminivorans]|uniref:Beta sliding clamp n=1 Tax=Candidatus Mcinerneyibacterium aminivorans TaxID=2703815 RepID=A0A5D0MDQ1_9BACT|nr:MAG: DNA polymerase III subunit beta [Candidatus Mcinerneyibacterium aminivorans]